MGTNQSKLGMVGVVWWGGHLPVEEVWDTLLPGGPGSTEPSCVRSVVSDSVRPHGLSPSRLLSPWDFLGKNTGTC